LPDKQKPGCEAGFYQSSDAALAGGSGGDAPLACTPSTKVRGSERASFLTVGTKSLKMRLPEGALPTESKRMEQNSSSQYPRALIVEDETMIALGLEAHLRELGFQACDLAADGHQALSHAASNPPNVVLMDVNLEGNREGIELARKLRETCDVPIVFVTGCTDSETIQMLRSEVPGAPVLPKPVWGDRLTDAVENVMTFRMW
jgi:CheY-like chemotaxis protein